MHLHHREGASPDTVALWPLVVHRAVKTSSNRLMVLLRIELGAKSVLDMEAFETVTR